MFLLHSVVSNHTSKEMVQIKFGTIGCYFGLLLGFCCCCVEVLLYITCKVTRELNNFKFAKWL